MKVPESLPVFIGDLEYEAFFDYQPPEPEIGVGESLTICSIELRGMDMTGLVSKEEHAELEETLLADLHQYMTDYHDAKGDYLYQMKKDNAL